MQTHLFQIKASGPYACFSRPELKSERMSYSVMTPGSARGFCEALFWKPEFRWEIREIWVLNPIQHVTIFRNEIESWQGENPIVVEQQRQQRMSLILKDVSYVICAEMRLQPRAKEPLKKYLEQFERYLARGRQYHAPYFGTREFAAEWEAATGDEQPQPLDLTLGNMLFDQAYIERPGGATESKQKEEGGKTFQFYRHDANGDRRVVTGRAEALFFPAELRKGKLVVPREKYDELYRLENRHV